VRTKFVGVFLAVLALLAALSTPMAAPASSIWLKVCPRSGTCF
jgi:hypothetical protein